jgi:hypothetical protein
MVCISNVGNKYIAAFETEYGTSPTPFTSVDLGHIQKITVNEEENMEKMSSLNSGHLSAVFEDGLYWCNVSIETQVSKASLPNLLKFALGTRTDGTDYAIVSDPTLVSMSLKFFYQTTKCGLINGMAIKDFEISAAKGEMVSMTLNCIAKKLSKTTETIAPSTNTDAKFSFMDVSATIGGTAYVLNTISITGNWNVSDDEGRGIEAVGAGERRLLQTVLRHRLDISGSYESEVADTQEFGYLETRANQAIVVTLSRAPDTDNVHVFTMTNTRSNKRGQEMSTDNKKKVITYDFEALDLGVSGDL